MPSSLADDSMTPVWIAVRHRLETKGHDNRGRVRVPDLARPARLTLSTLVGREVGMTVDLTALETALVQLGVGTDLAAALDALGHPVDPSGGERRVERQVSERARATARSAVAMWPEPWAAAWVDEVIRAGILRGMNPDRSDRFIASVRIVLDRIADGDRTVPLSRVDLAATSIGSSHALDTGTRLEAATVRALARTVANDQDVWSSAGVHTDLVSAPVVTWLLPVSESSPTHRLTSAAAALGTPVHLTQFVLQRFPAVVPSGTIVLVTENPRIVEAAAQRGHPWPVMSTNGNPSGAVRLLIRQLLGCGAELRYHGDFDAAGLSICARMMAIGLQPWKMGASDYERAVALSAASVPPVDLPTDEAAAPSTPWDPRLQSVFDASRRIVHEERLIDELLIESKI
ncbi:MAG: DUF2399 domain-containing protein [Ilumatobacteraceae bacterium]